MTNKRKKRWSALAVGCVTALAGCASRARPSGEEPPARPAAAQAAQSDVSRQVDALLSGYERVPRAEDWQRLGPSAFEELERIYVDVKALPSKRSRAVASMAQVEHPRAEERLVAIVRDERAEPQYRSTAALALGHKAGERALPALAPLLDSQEPRLRDAAARALGKLSGEEARKTLEDRLDKEPDPTVREAIQHSLTRQVP